MNKRILFLLVGCLTCLPTFAQKMLPQGTWRVELELQNQKLPFILEAFMEKGKQLAYLRNGDEKLRLDEWKLENDSLVATLHIFDAILKGKLTDNVWKGYWIKLDTKKPYLVPFRAVLGEKSRFTLPTEARSGFDFEGTWEVTFKDSKGGTYPAVGIFKQKNTHLTGTFLTTTGDYRYLEGIAVGKAFWLSAFDGNHAFLFKATGEQDKLTGEFWAGKGGYETFTAIKNEKASLPDANSLTYLKDGYERLEFAFPNLENKLVSLQDERYKGKVVIIQILGSWCPNCMDETSFLAPYYAKNSKHGIEVIGLAYERSADFTQAKTRLEKLKKRYQIEYELLLAGISDKQEAAKTLPALNAVLAFPTTIFIDKQGKVRRIHTGFAGAGTGIHHEKFKEEFGDFVKQLLKE